MKTLTVHSDQTEVYFNFQKPLTNSYILFHYFKAFDIHEAFLTDANDSKRSVSFLVLGDWGGLSFHPFTTPVQTSVADQMAKVAAQGKASFVVALGDNFYLFGVENVDDPRFQVIFMMKSINTLDMIVV